MFDIGFLEVVLIAIVTLIAVGPKRLPKIIIVIGLSLGHANSSIQYIRNQVSQELHSKNSKQKLKTTANPPNSEQTITQTKKCVMPEDKDGNR